MFRLVLVFSLVCLLETASTTAASSLAASRS